MGVRGTIGVDAGIAYLEVLEFFVGVPALDLRTNVENCIRQRFSANRTLRYRRVDQSERPYMSAEASDVEVMSVRPRKHIVGVNMCELLTIVD